MTARDRARTSNLARRQDTREALELRRLNQRDPTYGGDGYRVRTLGAAGSIPGRTRSKTSRGSIGEPLDLLGAGLGSLDAASDQEIRAVLRDLQLMIQAVANRRGILLFKGDETNPDNDPNDEANDGENRAYQRYDNQLLYTGDRLAPGKLFVHAQATTTEPETWLEIETGGGPTILYRQGPPEYDIDDPINNPPPHAPSDGDIWVDLSLGNVGAQYRYWRYREQDNLYYNASGNITFFGGSPINSGISPNSLVTFDSLYSRRYDADADEYRTWHFLWIDETWEKASCCIEHPEPPEGNDTCPAGTYRNNNDPYGQCTSQTPCDQLGNPSGCINP
ncbi:hypothetical protein Lepto7375DRAFT_1841 [Leptolyngbya sp. PCC 7375]|nr:hypothetical protein Lepto7375DRAFT_1841 [Leptolyngbya sp. PCC 7375]